MQTLNGDRRGQAKDDVMSLEFKKDMVSSKNDSARAVLNYKNREDIDSKEIRQYKKRQYRRKSCILTKKPVISGHRNGAQALSLPRMRLSSSSDVQETPRNKFRALGIHHEDSCASVSSSGRKRRSRAEKSNGGRADVKRQQPHVPATSDQKLKKIDLSMD